MEKAEGFSFGFTNQSKPPKKPKAPIAQCLQRRIAPLTPKAIKIKLTTNLDISSMFKFSK
jgi:hypothetical protein